MSITYIKRVPQGYTGKVEEVDATEEVNELRETLRELVHADREYNESRDNPEISILKSSLKRSNILDAAGKLIEAGAISLAARE